MSGISYQIMAIESSSLGSESRLQTSRVRCADVLYLPGHSCYLAQDIGIGAGQFEIPDEQREKCGSGMRSITRVHLTNGSLLVIEVGHSEFISPVMTRI